MPKPRRLVGLAALAGIAAVVRRLAERRGRLSRVADDLRHPILYATPSVRSDRSLRVGRALAGLSTKAKPPMPLAERRTAEGVRVLVYDAPDRPRPSGALLWIHGGGLVLGVPEQSHETCARMAREAGVLVVNVDYRLAPEDPFPAGLDDCTAALRWLHDGAGSLGVDPARIAVGGDSAGGGLTAAVCQRALDEGGPAVAFQLLVYPMLDDRTALRTDPDPAAVHTWTPESNRYAWTAYLGQPPAADVDPPAYAAPARRSDLAGLPPTWLGVGDLDLFLEEDLDYARRLEAAGVPCELLVVPGMYHAADAIPSAATAQRFRDAMVEAVRRSVGATVSAG